MNNNQKQDDFKITNINEDKRKKRFKYFENITQSALNSLSANIVILDQKGRIKYTNKSWDDFSNNNGLKNKDWYNVNYLKISNVPNESKENPAEGIKKVMDGEFKEYILEYPCHSPGEKRWFRMRVTPFCGKGPYSVVISHENITEKKLLYDKLDRSINNAIKMHKEFLPRKIPNIEGYDMSVLYEPSGKIGGDIYNVIRKENKVIFYISDVIGHELDSAMLNIFVKEQIKNQIGNLKYNTLSPGQIIKNTAINYIEEQFSPEYYFALMLGIIDLSNNTFTIANAGIQIPPLLIKANNDSLVMNIRGVPISSILSSFEIDKYIEEKSYKFDKYNILAICTDGIVEQSNGQENFGIDKYHRELMKNSNKNVEDIKNYIYDSLKEFIGTKKIDDDITLLVIKRVK